MKFDPKNLGEPHHARRYQRSWEVVQSLISSWTRPVDILNLGEGREFGQALAACENILYVETSSDLREPLNVNLRGRFDIVICMETIEHIKDRECDPLDTFTGRGIKTMLDEAHKVLRPRGRLLLTTPNVCAWSAFARLARGSHPFAYQPHHRELAPPDVRTMLENCNFVLEQFWTEDVWGQHRVPPHKLQAAADFVKRVGGSTDMRGDIIFAVARRV